jgi:DNA-binding MarR family transcriptional regulator
MCLPPVSRTFRVAKGAEMTAVRLSQLQKRILRWLAADHQRTQGRITSSHQELVRALQGDKANISHSLHTLEARGWLVIGRSAGGKAESLRLTPEGQKWACQFAGSCD